MPARDYDLIIIGGGPAGLTAGIYCRMRRLSVLVAEDSDFFRNQVSRLISAVGYNVLAAEDGEAAGETKAQIGRVLGVPGLTADVVNIAAASSSRTASSTAIGRRRTPRQRRHCSPATRSRGPRSPRSSTAV